MSKIKTGSKNWNMSDTSGKKGLKNCTQVQWALPFYATLYFYSATFSTHFFCYLPTCLNFKFCMYINHLPSMFNGPCLK